MKRKKIHNKIFIYINFFCFTTCLIFLFNNIFQNFNEVNKALKIEYIIILIIISILNLNIINYRYYYFLRKKTEYSKNYLNWSRLFFRTLVMNFFLNSGIIFRAIQLKKDGLSYTKFISLNYIIYLLIFIINFFFFTILFYFLTKKKIILLGLFFTLLVINVLMHTKTYYFFENFLKNNFIFIKGYKKKFIHFFFYCKKYLLLKKPLLIFSFLTLLSFLFEGVAVYLISLNVLSNYNFYTIMQLFFIVFFINKFLFTNNLLGLNELIIGLFSEIIGLVFFQGFLIQLIFRLSIYMGIVFNNVLYYFINLKKIS
jgi:hypothetical protein